MQSEAEFFSITIKAKKFKIILHIVTVGKRDGDS
jgi:hypothetical protein